jgi:2,3-bisphosphoglycerate-dependent phosphoglycerate mutase
MSCTLILVRHGESEFNARNLFTGWTDVRLTDRGVAEARGVADLIHDAGLRVDAVFCSALKRTADSARVILDALGRPTAPMVSAQALNERDYGELTGLNKDEARARWGEDQVRLWRRSYDVPPPGGESLRDTIARVLAYYLQEVLPAVMRDQTVLLVGHGNTLRALSYVLDRLTPTEVTSVEFATGAALVYRLAADTTVTAKSILRP